MDDPELWYFVLLKTVAQLWRGLENCAEKSSEIWRSLNEIHRSAHVQIALAERVPRN
ncbi:hypothetical protein [Massilia phosphatilytica]